MSAIDTAEKRLVRMVSVLVRQMREHLASTAESLRTRDGKITRDALNIARAGSAARVLRDEIVSRGIGSVRISLRRQLDEIIKDVAARSKDLGLDGMFGEASREAIAAIADADDREIASLAGQAADRVSSYLMRAVTGGGDRDTLLLDIQRILDSTERQAETLVGTILNSFGRQLTIMQAEENDIEEYAYVGPDDDVIRDWCSHWVGLRGTPEEFEETAEDWGRDKQPGPVMVYGGGYNCRHRFVPITARNRDRYEKGPR